MTLLLVGIGFHTVAWQPPSLWTDRRGIGEVASVVADSNGVYAGGSDGASVFLSRYDLAGQRVWNQYFGNSTRDEIRVIGLGPDGVYVVGVLNFTGFVRRYDVNGSILWTIKYDGLLSVVAGSVFLSSVVAGEVFLSSANILRAFDPNGNLLWTNPLGNNTSINSMDAYSGTDRVYLVGYVGSSWSSGFLRSYDLNGSPDLAKNLACSCYATGLSIDASGLYVSGLAGSTGEVVKLDLVGRMVWAETFDAPDGTPLSTVWISVGSSGIYLAVTSSASGIGSGFLMRYDANGNQVWSVQTPVSSKSVSVGQDGVYVGGVTFDNGLLSKYGEASSLVLFGVNPPFSFTIIVSLAGVVALSIFWLMRQRKKRIRLPKSVVPYSSPKPSSGDARWVRKPP